MNHYELLCILSGKIAETDIAAVEKSIEELVRKNASAFHYAHHMERKRLAYPINHHNYGYYFVVEFDAEKSGTAIINTELKLSADVLRHSIVVRATVGVPLTVERKQSFDALPTFGDIEEPLARSPRVQPSKRENDVVAQVPLMTAELPVKEVEPKVEESTPVESVRASESPKEKKKQEKLSYEELDKKLDEIINNDLF